MAKPIFIMTLALKGNGEGIWELVKEIQETLTDYHVIGIIDGVATENKYQMFSDKEIEPIKLEELKERLNVK